MRPRAAVLPSAASISFSSYVPVVPLFSNVRTYDCPRPGPHGGPFLCRSLLSLFIRQRPFQQTQYTYRRHGNTATQQHSNTALRRPSPTCRSTSLISVLPLACWRVPTAPFFRFSALLLYIVCTMYAWPLLGRCVVYFIARL